MNIRWRIQQINNECFRFELSFNQDDFHLIKKYNHNPSHKEIDEILEVIKSSFSCYHLYLNSISRTNVFENFTLLD